MDSHLMALPCEIRFSILCLALKDKGGIELQYPTWADNSVFWSPLFSVCRDLRVEALQAFYETNRFLWLIDLTVQHRSDPTKYTALQAIDTSCDTDRELDTALLSPLPWEYSHLRRHLRHLQIHIYTPHNTRGDTELVQEQWRQLPKALDDLVTSLDRGSHLQELQIVIVARGSGPRLVLTHEQIDAFDRLAGFEVRGRVKVRTRGGPDELSKAIADSELERRMKA
ncbi:hypothetical protein LTR17_024353 [Elasticomyces elasticus]|nr:hypothetical protein LTR17_024353 [Elasticomyces elasticus]